MPSLAEVAFAALLLQLGTMPQSPASGPQGSSQPAPGEQRFDAIGYASLGEGTGISVSAPGLTGDFAEVTSIESGKTIVAIVETRTPPSGRIAVLSRGAAQALGIIVDPAGIRVRPISPPGPEIASLRAGQANVRADAPPALIAALKRKLAETPVTAPVVTSRPVPAAAVGRSATRRVTPVPAASPQAGGRYVQYAALSSPERAASLARTINGVVARTGMLYAVRRGPFASDAAAKLERARAVGLGYRDASIVRITP